MAQVAGEETREKMPVRLRTMMAPNRLAHVSLHPKQEMLALPHRTAQCWGKQAPEPIFITVFLAKSRQHSQLHRLPDLEAMLEGCLGVRGRGTEVDVSRAVVGSLPGGLTERLGVCRAESPPCCHDFFLLLTQQLW